MQIHLRLADSGYGMDVRNESGNSVYADGPSAIGGAEQGMRPMEILLASLCSCMTIDVLNILRKQRYQIDRFEIRTNGERKETGRSTPYSHIRLHFIIGGGVARKDAERAVSLSLEKYCSVAHSLHPDITFETSVELD